VLLRYLHILGMLLSFSMLNPSVVYAWTDPTRGTSFKEYDSLTKAIEDEDHISTRAIYRIELDELRPTQSDVGMIEVHTRENKIERRDEDELLKYFLKGDDGKGKLAKIVIGPRNQIWLVDGHHLARAFYDLEYKFLLAKVVGNFSNLTDEDFEELLVKKKWTWLQRWPKGATRPVQLKVSELPKSIGGLRNDPFRSLAWAVKAEGGFKESKEPYQQFYWSDFFREYITEAELNRDWDGSVQKALRLAWSEEARKRKLPGYIPGPVPLCKRSLKKHG